MAAELYTARDVARIFALQESRVLYWARTGFVGPSVRKAGRAYYTFQDLISVRAAKELLDGGLTLQAVRKNLAALRAALPDVDRPLARMRVISDGDRLVVVGEEMPFEPITGQLVMDFAVESLSARVAEVMELPAAPVAQAPPSAPPLTAYGWFQRGTVLDAEDTNLEAAVECYRRAIELDPHLAAAHTNLGHALHRLGRRGDARAQFEKAIALDPEQPEARYNLANLLDELGELDPAIAEWTRVVALTPDFADAHFNLGAALARRGDAGDTDLARAHLRRYLTLDSSGEWATSAEDLLGQL